jgi:hypothetical protein
MTNTLRKMLAVCAVSLAIASAPAIARAACGDLNNDGSVNSADVSILAQCVGSACPGTVTPGPLCGTGSASACADVFNEGAPAFSAPNLTDLATLQDSVAGLLTLHDLCQPEIAATCPGGTISSSISTSTHWGPAPCTVTIDNTILVETPAGAPTTVLTIDPGVVIKGTAGSPNPSALIVLAGARLSARGTPTDPIIFTSTAAVGSRASQDTGGVMLNGRSTVNRPNCTNFSEGVPEPYGGCINNDSSGIVTYLRSEFGGRLFTPNNELNSFTMNGVGSRTVVNHVQGHHGADDCIEWFGGTVNTSFMVGTGCGDDGLDWQLGTTGNLQFGVILQRQANMSGGSNGSNGLEADNSEFGFNDQPRSHPTLCNVTLIGDPTGATNTSGSGWLNRRGNGGILANSVVTGFLQSGARMTEGPTSDVACASTVALRDPNTCIGGANHALACTGPGDCPGGTCEEAVGRIKSSVFYGNGNNTSTGTTHCSSSGTTRCSGCEWYGLEVAGEGVVPATGVNTVNPNYQVAADYWNVTCTPGTGVCPSFYTVTPSFSGGTVPTAIDCRTLSDSAAGFFQTTSYVGAFDPSGGPSGWLTSPWISFDYK